VIGSFYVFFDYSNFIFLFLLIKNLFNKLESVHYSTNSNIPFNNDNLDNNSSNDSKPPSVVHKDKKVYLFDDLLTNKKEIFRLVKNRGGVYIFQNKINGKKYVGSSVNLKARLTAYFAFNIVYKAKSLIFPAIIKYGLINFSLVIIIIPNATKESVRYLEQYVIDSYNSEYNILKIVDAFKISGSQAVNYGRKHSEQTKFKMSLSKVGDKNSMYGISLSGEDNGFFGKIHSELTRSKMRKAKGTSIFIYTTDQSILLHTFDSAHFVAYEDMKSPQGTKQLNFWVVLDPHY
jgi:group I intron endonuclease